MKIRDIQIKLFVIAILLAGFFGAQFYAAKAQERPQIFVTWRAESFAPPEFTGKVMPTAGSLVTVSLEVVDGGRPANLADQTIYWYLNNDLIENRPGTKSVSFRAPASAPSAAQLRIELPSYRGALLMKTLRIPIVRPEAVIKAPYPGKNFSGAQVRAIGVPYFFNIQDVSPLSFSWKVNGAFPEASERPRELVVNIDPNLPAGTTLNVSLSISNSRNPDESASNFLILTKQ